MVSARLCCFGCLSQQLFVGLEPVNNPIRLPLGPHEVVVGPFLVVTDRPPKTSLQRRLYDLRIVTFADVVPVGGKCLRWKLSINTVGVTDLLQESAIVTLLQLDILVFVLGIGQILGKLIDLSCQAFQTVGSRLYFLFFQSIFLQIWPLWVSDKATIFFVISLYCWGLSKRELVHLPLDY